jgi:hypothetical protein
MNKRPPRPRFFSPYSWAWVLVAVLLLAAAWLAWGP